MPTTKTEAPPAEKKSESHLPPERRRCNPFLFLSTALVPHAVCGTARPSGRRMSALASLTETGVSRFEHLTIRLNGAAVLNKKIMKEKEVKNKKINFESKS